MPGPIAVYFDFPSVHSYLGLAQLQEVAARHGRAIDWRPISLMDLWKAHDYMPLGNPIAKGRYIKKDFIRTAGLLGLPLTIPASFPGGDLSHARHLVWRVRATDQALAGALTVRLMTAYWAVGRDIAEPEILAELAAAAGIGADEVAASTVDADARAACAAETASAAAQGIFGAPHMIVDGEPFWGHDRIRYLDMWLHKQAEAD